MDSVVLYLNLQILFLFNLLLDLSQLEHFKVFLELCKFTIVSVVLIII